MLQWLRELFSGSQEVTVPPTATLPRRDIDKIVVGIEVNDTVFKRQLEALKKDVGDFDKMLTAAEKRHVAFKRKSRRKAKTKAKRSTKRSRRGAR